MAGYTFSLLTSADRDKAKAVVDRAPWGSSVVVKGPGRTLDQNAKMHAMLTDISLAQPLGKKKTPDMWKAIIMHACGWSSQFEEGLDGQPFPIGYRSSKLTKAQMSELIEFMYAFGAENGIKWSEPQEERGAA